MPIDLHRVDLLRSVERWMRRLMDGSREDLSLEARLTAFVRRAPRCSRNGSAQTAWLPRLRWAAGGPHGQGPTEQTLMAYLAAGHDPCLPQGIQIADAVTPETDKRVVATVRFSKHAAGSRSGGVGVSCRVSRLAVWRRCEIVALHQAGPRYAMVRNPSSYRTAVPRRPSCSVPVTRGAWAWSSTAFATFAISSSLLLACIPRSVLTLIARFCHP